MANLISYTTDCPECKKNNVEAKLSLDMDSGKIICGANAAHEFAELPDEPAPVLEDVRPDETNKLETGTAPQVAQTVTIDGALTGPERMAEIMAKRVPEVAVKPPVFEFANIGPKPVIIEASSSDSVTVSVGIGGAVILPGGDALCGIRVAEAWISAMQSIGEESRPPRSVADVLQEYVDQGLLDWFCQPMQTK